MLWAEPRFVSTDQEVTAVFNDSIVSVRKIWTDLEKVLKLKYSETWTLKGGRVFVNGSGSGSGDGANTKYTPFELVYKSFHATLNKEDGLMGGGPSKELEVKMQDASCASCTGHGTAAKAYNESIEKEVCGFVGQNMWDSCVAESAAKGGSKQASE